MEKFRSQRTCGRGVVEAAFGLLDYVADLGPVRLVELAAETGIPRSTVYRLLQQLTAVGAIRREGERYSLGPIFLGLGARVSPNSQLRAVARRPIANLAAATDAAVILSATIDGVGLVLEFVDANASLGIGVASGDRLRAGTAVAVLHNAPGRWDPVIDAGEVDPEISCVAVPIPLGNGEVVGLTTVIAAPEPPSSLIKATRNTAARIGALLRPWENPPSGQSMS